MAIQILKIAVDAAGAGFLVSADRVDRLAQVGSITAGMGHLQAALDAIPNVVLAQMELDRSWEEERQEWNELSQLLLEDSWGSVEDIAKEVVQLGFLDAIPQLADFHNALWLLNDGTGEVRFVVR
jgi:hypothetical protein